MIIGLCGKPHSGKSEVRKILEENWNFEVINTKIPLAQVSSIITGIDETKFLTTHVKERTFRSHKLRDIMGTIGNTIEDLFGENYLLERALNNIKINKYNYVIDALRKNQYTGFNGWIVEVCSEKGKEIIYDYDKFNPHSIDYVVKNDGSFEELKSSVTRMLYCLSTTAIMCKKPNEYRIVSEV